MTLQRAFIAMWGVWAIFWIVNAFGTKASTARLNPAWRFFALGAVIALYFLFRSYPAFFGRRLVPFSDAVRVTGACLCGVGIAFAIWARVALGRNWSGNPTLKEGHELITSGPYRLARHPIYTGLLLALFGTCLTAGRVEDLIFFVAAVAALAKKMQVEETMLRAHFPESYPAYRRRTKALIPFVL